MAFADRRAGEAGRREGGRVDLDAQLLAQLADQSGLGQLALLDLAAGKFPQARHRPIRRALLQQDPARLVDQRRRHHRHCRNFLQVAASR